MSSDLEKVRRELVDKCSVNELLESKSKIYTTVGAESRAKRGAISAQ